MKVVIYGLVVLLFGKSNLAFEVTSSSITPPNGVTEGSTVILDCKSDSYYEYCSWTHNGEVCNFEWKRSHAAVLRQTCLTFRHRMRFIGNYEQHECKVELKNVSPSDVGKWECELESYVLAGSKGSGYTSKKSVMLKLNATNEGSDEVITVPTTVVSSSVTSPTSDIPEQTTADEDSNDETTTNVYGNDTNLIGIQDGHDDVANRINDVDNDIANSEEINSLIKKSGPGPIVPIVLVSVIAVLSIILAGVYIVYKKRPSLPRLKIPFNTPKFSMKTLEEAHEVENETSHIVTQSGGDDNIDGRGGGGDRYLGAKAYDPVVP